jgi:DNA processing protein
MSLSLSANTQAALLLAAPLIDGATELHAPLLSPTEYRKICSVLSKFDMQPSDLVQRSSAELPEQLKALVDDSRLRALLDRGFQLTQAFERWQTRAIWISGHMDDTYPGRISARRTGLEALRQHGAIPWPEPARADDLLRLIETKSAEPSSPAEQLSLL